MKKLSILCVLLSLSVLVFIATAFSATYRIDILESGNPGGWTGSSKTFDDELKTTPVQTLEMDIWMTGAPGNATAGGLWFDFSGSTDKISYISAGRYLTNGSEAGNGPWDPLAGVVVDEPDGPGTLMVIVGHLGSVAPDGDGDIIIAKVVVQYLSAGAADIMVSTIPSTATWGPAGNGWNDATIPTTTFTFLECTVNEDCDDGAFCTGTATCVDGACVAGPDPCPDDGIWCNGDEGCDEVNDQCVPGEPRCQDDGLFCNGDELCNEDDDQCEQINVPCDDDGDPCTDNCDEPTDTCYVCNATGPDDDCCTTSDACATAEICVVEYTDFYVDGTDGDNTNDGTAPDPDHAWKTITHALSEIPTLMVLDDQNRATVHVAASVYNRTMWGGDAETFPIVMKEYISLYGDGYKDTIIDAGGDVYPINNVIMFAQEDYIQNVTIDGFTITGGNAYGGGGIMINWANPVISNCNITGNIAYGMNGGGIYNKRSNTTISNCIIAENQALAQRGGGISCGNQSHLIITNCTIVNNLSGSLEWEGGGGLFTGDDSNPTITNCIFWGNEGDDPTTPEDENQILAREGSGIVVNYSCIDGGWSGSGTGNTDQDPKFFGTGYHLMYGSSCIDSGDSGLTTVIPEFDIDGNERYDACFIPDTGVGPFTYYDRGAREYQGDSDLDGILDDADLSCTVGDNPCSGGTTENCDDNCTFIPNADQADEGDGDGVGDVCDNCPIHPNGTLLGTCARNINPNLTLIMGPPCSDTSECGETEFCMQNQEDTNGNGLGDVCECESDFDCDDDVDSDDANVFLDDFGRNQHNDPCTIEDPCPGDLDCDEDSDAHDVTKFLEDFGRNLYNDPCPSCSPIPPCEYE